LPHIDIAQVQAHCPLKRSVHVCRAVCSKGYEHYYGVCIACPKGKVKNVVSYGQCKCVFHNCYAVLR